MNAQRGYALAVRPSGYRSREAILRRLQTVRDGQAFQGKSPFCDVDHIALDAEALRFGDIVFDKPTATGGTISA